MEELRPNGERAKNAILLTWAVFTFEIINLISSYLQYNLLQTVANGGYISDEAANANDLREQIVGGIYFIIYIAFLIMLIMWFRRAYYNLHQRVDTLSFSDGWAAGAWFVPIISLYRPCRIMKELYVETKELFREKGLSEKVNYTTKYLGWWWTLWIISSLLGTFIFRFSRQAEAIDDYMILTVAQMISNVLGIPLALFTIKVIKDYAKVEPLLNEITEEMEKETNDCSNLPLEETSTYTETL